jgi:NADPH2:quinone reductase
MTGTMQRFADTALGALDGFALEAAPIPVPGPGEVRLRIEATGLGFVDGLIMAGRYQIRPPLPYVPGGEIAGIVDTLGEGVAGLAIGDPVVSWQFGGGAAEYTVVPAASAAPRPEGVSAVAAAALLLDAATAQYALFDRGGLRAGESVLVLGAAGGVGAAAVQLAAHAGAFVVAAVSSDMKAAAARAAGAHATVDYRDPEWRTALRAILPGPGVDVVVDPVGGAAFEPAFRSLAKGGRHLVIGFAGGDIPKLPANLPLLKSAALVGVDIRHLHDNEPVKADAGRRIVLDLIARGVLRPQIARVVPLAEAPAAFALLGRRDRIGKVVLAP